MENSGAHQALIFFIGLTLFGLFIAYFAVEKEHLKRYIGTILAAGVISLSLYFFNTMGIPKAIDLAGGSQFVVELQPASEEARITPDDQEQVINVFRNRLDPDGTKNLQITAQGDDRVVIQMPGISDEERAEVKKTILKTAKLEIVLVMQGEYESQTGRQRLLAEAREGRNFTGYKTRPWIRGESRIRRRRESHESESG